ncbi:hypothetical protein IIZ81_00020 [Candidatus Saccharibacteria bacterium]|nr:hypothetical protein [Candidatus Saccharibacteria bacterium]
METSTAGILLTNKAILCISAGLAIMLAISFTVMMGLTLFEYYYAKRSKD